MTNNQKTRVRVILEAAVRRLPHETLTQEHTAALVANRTLSRYCQQQQLEAGDVAWAWIADEMCQQRDAPRAPTLPKLAPRIEGNIERRSRGTTRTLERWQEKALADRHTRAQSHAGF